MAKTSTDRVRAYRERQRANKPPKKPPKSGLQRNREFRARQRAMKERVLHNPSTSPESNEDTSEPYSVEETSSIVEIFNTTDSEVASTSEDANTCDIKHESNEPDPAEFQTNGGIPTSVCTKIQSLQPVHHEIAKQSLNILRGSVCSICDRMWLKADVNPVDPKHEQLLRTAFPAIFIGDVVACDTCQNALTQNTVPILSNSNDVVCPEPHDQLPESDIDIEEYDSKAIVPVPLELPIPPKNGGKKRKQDVQDNSLSHAAIAKKWRTLKIQLNSNKSMLVKRRHLRAVPSLAQIIKKSRGGTFGEFVHEYNKMQTQENPKFSYLQTAYRRLHSNQLQTLEKVLNDFMTSRKGVPFCSSTGRSLRAHILDMGDEIINRSNFLLIAETSLHNDERMDVSNFNFVAKFKGSKDKTKGIATYRNAPDRTTIVTPNMDINVHQANEMKLHTSGIGDICTAKCRLETGQMIMMVAISISNSAKVNDIIELIHEVLLVYTIEGAALLRRNLDKMPIIMSGDFNIDFNSDEAQLLIRFLDEKFNLKLNTGTIIDAVFSRYLENLYSKLFVSYFSYHKPVISHSENEAMDLD